MNHVAKNLSENGIKRHSFCKKLSIVFGHCIEEEVSVK